MKTQKYLILPDVHSPFENKTLINKICKLALDVKFYGLVFCGDFADMFSLSSYAENSLKKLKDISQEYEHRKGRELIAKITGAVSPKEKHFLYGNHEHRYFKTLEKGDNSKLAIKHPTEEFRLGELGYKVYENWTEDAVKIGPHLEVVHGLNIGVHTAKKTLDDYQGSVIFGHSHRVQSHIEAKRGAWNIGCLCDISHEAFFYMPRVQRARWTNAFAIVDLFDDGTFSVQTVQAWQDRFVAEGKVY